MLDGVTREDVVQLTRAIQDLVFATRAMPRPEMPRHGGCGAADRLTPEAAKDMILTDSGVSFERGGAGGRL